MPSNAIVDSRLWVRLDFDTSIKHNSFFMLNPQNRAHFAAQLLMYDQIVIPTKDFGIVPILINWMGKKSFTAALQAKSIGFIRPDSIIGYPGSGIGISTYTLHSGPGKPLNLLQTAMFGPIESGPEIQLKVCCPSITQRERSKLVDLILKSSKQFNIESKFFKKNIRDESHNDILQNKVLLQSIAKMERKHSSKINLDRLSGIKDDQINVLGVGKPLSSGIDIVLRVAEINLELVMAHMYDQADISTSVGADKILANKLGRIDGIMDVLGQFQKLLELNNIPDIQPIVAAGDLTIEDIWSLRQKRPAKKFRKWLRLAQSENARDLEKAYVSALGNNSIFDSAPMKVLRFITTSVAGIEPAAGLAFGAADSFIFDKMAGGYSPRQFLDEYHSLQLRMLK